MSKEQPAQPAPTPFNLDLSNSGRGVWLVKVPKYIQNFFEKAQGDLEVAKLKIKKYPGQKAQVSLSLSDAVTKIEELKSIPKEHKLDVSVVTKQTLGVFSHLNNNKEGTVVPDSEKEKLFMEGRIVQKLECRPIADQVYMKMKLDSIKKASIPARQVQSLDKVVNNFKPVSDHDFNIKYREQKKSEGKKSRDDKNAVLDMLYNAFEKHQYYNIKDLVKITNQPVSYLKEILKEVCDYNMKNPHKNTWELKKEYRHYKVEEKAEKKADDNMSEDSD